MSDRLFDSSFNYQKVFLKGSRTDAIPSGSGVVTITHNLGRIGSARVWYEPGNGRRFPITFEQYVDGGVSQNNLVRSINTHLTANTLSLTYENNDTVTRAVVTYYRIYYDA